MTLPFTYSLQESSKEEHNSNKETPLTFLETSEVTLYEETFLRKIAYTIPCKSLQLSSAVHILKLFSKHLMKNEHMYLPPTFQLPSASGHSPQNLGQ